MYYIGICGGEKVLRDERESEDEEDNRGESKVKALVRLSNWRKSFCFWSCIQSEIEPANLENKGLGGVQGFIDSETKSSHLFSWPLCLFPLLVVVFKIDRDCSLE